MKEKLQNIRKLIDEGLKQTKSIRVGNKLILEKMCENNARKTREKRVTFSADVSNSHQGGRRAREALDLEIPRRGRSSGPAPEIPHVQAKVLEWKIRK